MSKESKTWTFKAEDIFEDIPGDNDNVNMSIPPEVAEAVGLVPGDPIKISLGDQGTVIIEKLEKETSGKEEKATE
jgi:hypothetical protein